MASETFNFQVNGKAVTVTTERDRSLLEVLREDLKLTGTKYGCGEGACGACTVLIDGAKTLSCSTIVAEADGKSITTIEGLAKGQVLHPVQQAFLECEGFQCGYCTAGMIISTVALLEKTPNPTGSEIEQAMNGHLCRCCSYPNILRSIRRAIELSAGRRE